MERRVTLDDITVREVDGKQPMIVGYAAVFNRLSVDLGGFREILQPGAFRSAIRGDVRALWQHDSNFVLGRSSTGTLRLQEDEIGLRVEIDPPPTQWARDAVVSIQRGDVSQMSFGFNVPDGGDEWRDDAGMLVRTVITVNPLYDVSPVTFPAYPQTSVDIRSIEEALRARSASLSTSDADDQRARDLQRIAIRVKEIL